jgi:hypothetical protein
VVSLGRARHGVEFMSADCMINPEELMKAWNQQYLKSLVDRKNAAKLEYEMLDHKIKNVLANQAARDYEKAGNL